MLMKFINQLDDGSILLTAPVLIPHARDCDFENGETPLNESQVKAFKESYDKRECFPQASSWKSSQPPAGSPASRDFDFSLVKP